MRIPDGALRIIGSGTTGREHFQNLRLIPEVRVVALADAHPASLDAAAAITSSDVATHADYRALLARDDIDVLVIATPNYTHAAVLADVLPTGRHILVEKPLLHYDRGCPRGRRGRATAQGPVLGGDGVSLHAAGRAADRGGAARHRRPAAHAGDPRASLPAPREGRRLEPLRRNTGGTMVEKCCHFFDLMRLVTGDRPVRVFGSGGQDVNHLGERYDGKTPDILDNAFVIVDFAAGVRALLDLCMFAEVSPDQEEIVATGDGGKVACGVPLSELFIGCREPRQECCEHVPVPSEILAAGHHHGSTYYQHLAFLRALHEGDPPEVSARDGLLAVAMGVAAEKSIRERRAIEMAELGF